MFFSLAFSNSSHWPAISHIAIASKSEVKQCRRLVHTSFHSTGFKLDHIHTAAVASRIEYIASGTTTNLPQVAVFGEGRIKQDKPVAQPFE
jgi:hypothetical protein